MKRIINRVLCFKVCLVAMVTLALPAPSTAPLNFSFNFDFSSQPDLANFWLYTGTASSNYTSKVSMGTSTNIIIAGFPRNTLVYCNVTVMNTNGVEGDFVTEQSIRTFNKPKTVSTFKVSQ